MNTGTFLVTYHWSNGVNSGYGDIRMSNVPLRMSSDSMDKTKAEISRLLPKFKGANVVIFNMLRLEGDES